MKMLLLLLSAAILSHSRTAALDGAALQCGSMQCIIRTAALQCGSMQRTSPSSHPKHPTIRPSIHRSPTDTLPPLAVLHHRIDSFFAQQTQLQLLEFKHTKKGEWLKFLPNLGITYTVSGQPRPSISLSSGLLYQTQKAKHTRAAKRRQIMETNRLEAEQEKAKLQQLLVRYQLLQQEVVHQRSLHRVDEQLFAIREDEYLRQERAPSDYLQAKRAFLVQQQALREKAGQLQLLEMEILRVARVR